MSRHSKRCSSVVAAGAALSLALFMTVTSDRVAAAPPGTTTLPAASSTEHAKLEKEFAQSLTGTKLTGSYSTKDGQEKKDQYSIVRVEKGQGNQFLFTIEVKYQGATREVELPLPVEWAGDTPVIELTDYALPGYGKFTVRVMFFAGQYAGTWAHGDRGGLMWGKVEKATPSTQPAK